MNELQMQVSAPVSDRDSLIAAFGVSGLTISLIGDRDRLGGDPETILAIAAGASAVAASLSRIAHSWQRDITVDLRKKQCVVSKAGGRGGRVIVLTADRTEVLVPSSCLNQALIQHLTRLIDR